MAALAAHSAWAAKDDRPTMAVLDLGGTNLKAEELDVVNEALRDKVVQSAKYRVQDRAQMNEILSTQKANTSEACDESCVVEQGRLLQVAFLLTGTVRLVGSSTWISVRLTNVETGEVAAAVRETCKSCTFERVVEVVERVGGKLVGAPAEAAAAGAAPAPEPVTMTAAAQLVSRGKRSDPAFGGDDAGRAANYYFDALQRAPDDPEVIGLLAGALSQQGRWRQALPQFQRASELDPGNAERWIWLGVCLHKLELERAAREAYEKAILLAPNHVKGRVYLGHAKLLTGDTAGAVLEFKYALAKDPKNEQAQKGLKQAEQRRR